tara:strand:- start:677 stop:1249 length:573 start_codon:yes stop_codon:yes gene_type:complete
MNFKKAAMFGLDARIALAIFGALSVISGAALYSAIQQSKVTALQSQMAEVAKAYEQIYLDTATHIPVNSSFTMKMNYLVENPSPAMSNWNGPYIGFSANGISLDFPGYGNSSILRMETGVTWGATTSPDPAANCAVGEKCELWLQVQGVDSSIAKALDIVIDGADDSDAGDLRTVDGFDFIYWKMFPTYN